MTIDENLHMTHDTRPQDVGSAVVCDTPESIQLFQLLSIKGRLQLELKGLKFRIPTTPIVAQMMGVEKVQRKKALAYVQSRIDELTAPIVEDPA